MAPITKVVTKIALIIGPVDKFFVFMRNNEVIHQLLLGLNILQGLKSIIRNH